MPESSKNTTNMAHDMAHDTAHDSVAHDSTEHVTQAGEDQTLSADAVSVAAARAANARYAPSKSPALGAPRDPSKIAPLATASPSTALPSAHTPPIVTPPTTPPRRAADRLDAFFRRLVCEVFDQLNTEILLTDPSGTFRLGRLGRPDASSAGPCDPAAPAPAAPAAAPFCIHVRDPRFYRLLVTQGHLGACESYIQGQWDCDQLTGLIQVFANNLKTADQLESGFARLAGLAFKAVHALKRNTPAGSRKNILAHYDLGNDFFQLFLDPTLAYSSAVFTHPAQDLQAAQRNKYETVCRALNLRPQDHLLEIGTGWGGLAIHAAKHHGCRVTTTTISDAQYQEANQRIAAAGLSDRITLLKQDYRTLTGAFDKAVSIEMIEAVGHEYYEPYFKTICDCLKPQGAALIQAITIADQRYDAARKHVDFIKRYVFPGSCIPSVTRMTQAMTRSGDLRLHTLTDYTEHYAETLKRWRLQLLARQDQALALGYTQPLLRLWHLYLCYCEGGFLERNIGLVHMKLTKPGYRQSL